MKPPRPLEIIGGGLAGLGLALGLARAGLPVTLHDAGRYPRHRVCGEFITSLDLATVTTLGLADFLADAAPARHVTWFRHDRALCRQTLPTPALRLSRHALDLRLVHAARAAGAAIQENSRLPLTPVPGRILAAGRRPATTSPWVGLKLHVRDLAPRDELELHFGHRAYVGITRVENGASNVCGLFPSSALAAAAPLDHALRAVGLAPLADRVAAAIPVPDSACAVAGLNYGAAAPPTDPAALNLGYYLGLIPPYTGHGMTIALQSAARALPHLARWSRHPSMPWPEIVATVRQDLATHFTPRLHRARRLHTVLLHPSAQASLALAARCRLLPLNLLYRLLH